MSPSEFENNLEKYAQVILKIGLNLQPGQRLMIGTPAPSSETRFEAAPLVHQLARIAYRMGARLVDVNWGDPELHRIRLREAAPDTLEDYPTWRSDGYLEHVKNGDAILSILSYGPEMYEGLDPQHVASMQRAIIEHTFEARSLRSSGGCNWLGVCAPSAEWAGTVFPNLEPEEAKATLWDAIFRMCRVDQPDPVAAWRDHIAALTTVKDYLNARHYTALKYKAPGTDLTVGLPEGHVWETAEFTTNSSIRNVVNIPTEEVFTLPHRAKVDGVVTATMPLNNTGALVEDFSLTFENGQVVDMNAGKGEKILQSILDSDEGSCRLGEVALVPHSSPISQSGLLFYSTLYDENASSHLALGFAYKDSLKGGRSMSEDELKAAGANRSKEHVDFMIGSDKMDIDGVLEDGSSEPVMRGGEWAFEV